MIANNAAPPTLRQRVQSMSATRRPRDTNAVSHTKGDDARFLTSDYEFFIFERGN